MINGTMRRLGEERSAIRELFEYGRERMALVGKENVFDFSLGNPSVPAPDCVRKEIERLINDVPPEVLHGYTSAAGDPDVRTAVANFLAARSGVPVRADLVYMTCGAAASLTIALRAVVNEGDEVVLLKPYFPEYRVFVESVGGVVKEAETDGRFHIDCEAVRRALTDRTKAVIVNSPNNPTGAVYKKEELAALAALLRSQKSPVFFIADEPYRELTYGCEAPDVMALYERVILCYSFSKSLSLAGERIGYLAVSPNCENAGQVFSAVCGAGRSLGFVCAPSLFQRVCAACLGMTGDVSIYEENRTLLYDGLTALGFECVPPEGAFYLFVKAPEGDAKAFAEAAKEYELLLVPSDSFGVGGYVRISYCVPQERIKRALPRFGELAKSYRLKG